MGDIKRGKISNRIAMCKDCDGEGKKLTPGAKIAHNRFAEDTTDTCGTCQGSGLVRIKTEIVMTVTPIPALVRAVSKFSH